MEEDGILKAWNQNVFTSVTTTTAKSIASSQSNTQFSSLLFVRNFLLATFQLFYRIYDSFKCLRIIHGEVSENLAVETDVLLSEFAHKL